MYFIVGLLMHSDFHVQAFFGPILIVGERYIHFNFQ